MPGLRADLARIETFYLMGISIDVVQYMAGS